MSGKLDQSLDDIVSTRRKTGGRRGRGGRRVPNGTRVTNAAPAGGIQKGVKSGRGASKAIPSGPAAGSGDSKIIVSNLPSDVTESQIKEYFTTALGPVKRAMLTYGPNGISRGIATIVFSKPGTAKDAVVQFNGMLVDKRPMKVEVVVNASKAAAATGAKGLGDRMAQPKSARNQPKSAVDKMDVDAATNGRGRTKGRGAKRGRNAGRPKAKTADELDAEMTDYFGEPVIGTAATDGAAATNGAAANTNGGEIGMDDIS